jgi:hypothetical protein
MSTRASILAQIVLLAATLVIKLPGEFQLAADHQITRSHTKAIGTVVADRVGIYDADDALEREILDAVDRFTDAGLTLPELRIHVHESAEPCRGHMGLYNKGGDQHRIDLCQPYPEVITHELAHAWDYHNLDDATRQAFLDRAGLRVWSDQDVPHPARGVERAAYLISWALEDQPIQAISLGHYVEDLERYELLTGSPSPRIAHLEATRDSRK